MRNILSFILIAFTLIVNAQTSPTIVNRSSPSVTNVDPFLTAARRLGIPTDSTDNLFATTVIPANTIKLMYNTSLQKLRVYNPIDSTWRDAIEFSQANQQQPFIEPPFIIYNTNITHNLNGNGLSYIGAEIQPGVFLIRDFDEFGNDIGGIEGTNTIGSGSLFNTIKGIGNTIGTGSNLNTIVGENNSIGDATGFNQVSGEDNSIGNQSVSNIVSGFNNHLGENSNINLVSASNVSVGNNSDRNVFVGNNITAGDNVNGCFAAGQDIVIDSGAVFSAAWGVGHNPTCNYSYMYGSYGICQGAAILLGNGTDSLNKSNAFYIKANGELMHDGAYINRANQIHTAGGNATVGDNVKTFVYDPATAQTGATIFLPLNKKDGQEVTLLFGGTIASGNVINGWTLDGNGAAIIGNIPNNIKTGGLTFKYFEALNRWYKINKGD